MKIQFATRKLLGVITSATSCQINWFKLTYLLAHKARILYSPFHLVLGKHCRRPRQQELFSFEFGLLFLDLVLKKIIRILFFSFRLNLRIYLKRSQYLPHRSHRGQSFLPLHRHLAPFSPPMECHASHSPHSQFTALDGPKSGKIRCSL